VWPHVERALAFCLATDADGDGLIENARVGHGWTEGGPLGGAQVTLYLAALWRAALEGVARAADVLGEDRAAADCWARAARAGDALETVFRDARRGVYALDRRRDGARTWTQSALHAVPLLLGAVAPLRMERWLDEVAGESFSAPWGVRLVAAGDRHYDPQSYHGGSVWPLFTGWVALAEYRAGRPDAGFRHLAANARLPFERQLGAFDEVLHGATGVAAGVCGDQAWSAAALVAPVVEGMLGAEPDAPSGRLGIAPALPEGWDWMELRGLRCGETALDVRVRRRGPRLAVRVRRTGGPPLWLTVAPWLPSAGYRMLVDDHAVRPAVASFGALVKAAVGFQASGEHEVVAEPSTVSS
jgi:glycogen debranching enzyme